jgi:hypothetical protein
MHLTGNEHMLAINENARQQRKPACGQCGGTGYVYLWSVSRSGLREWYCDRSRCKRWWSEAKPIVAAPAIGFVGALKSVLPVVTRVGQLALKPAMNGSNAEPAQTAPSPVRVLVKSFAAADAAAAGGGESSGVAGLIAGDFMADRVDDTYRWRWSVHAPHG